MITLSYKDLIFDLPGEFGSSFDLSVRFRKPKEDLSGKSNFSTSGHCGDKAAGISCCFVVKFMGGKTLRDLRNLALLKDDKGADVVFDVVNFTLENLGIKQVVFDGDINVKKMDKLQAWSVDFGLKEQNSTPEKIEKREEPSNPEEAFNND